MSDKTLTFNWHETNRTSGDFDTFLNHFLVTVTTSERLGDDDTFDAVMEASDGARNVEVGITLNGIAVDADAWLRYMDEATDRWSRQRAEAILKERVGDLMDVFDKQRDIIESMMDDARVQVRESLTKAGITLGPDEDYDW